MSTISLRSMVSVLRLFLVYCIAGHAQAAKPIPIYTFGSAPDGAFPSGGLVKDEQGRLYGVTSAGGTFNLGTVYRLTHEGQGSGAWTEEILHSFDGNDGAKPRSALTLDSNGSVYGITVAGGIANRGTVFRLDPAAQNWPLTTLHHFGVSQTDGTFPSAGLILGSDGLLYGTTSEGPAANGFGTVFSLSTSGDEQSYAVLHAFSGSPSDGALPSTNLIELKNGSLVGATFQGGASNYGTAFQLQKNKQGEWKETVIHNFQYGPADLSGPYYDGSLVRGPNGNVYGCGYYGTFYRGGIYQLMPPKVEGDNWNEIVVYNFGTQENDPTYLESCGLESSWTGVLHGITDAGGKNKPSGSGTFFSLAPPTQSSESWTENVAYDFVAGPRGHAPIGTLLRIGKLLYGAAQYTGIQGNGPGLIYVVTQ